MSIISNEHQSGSPFTEEELDRLDVLKALSDENREWDKEFFEVLSNAWPDVSRELRTLRARVAELEQQVIEDDSAIAALDIKDARIHDLGARAESAEARVAELEKLFDDAGQGNYNVLALIDHYQSAAMAESERSGVAEARVKELEEQHPPDDCDHCGNTMDGHVCSTADVCLDCWNASKRRITDLESQLAAAREEQGLEDRVATALGPRYQALQLTRLAMSGIWQACWCAPAWSSRNERKAQAPTLPALLRALLAVEKGGPDEG